MIIYFIFHFVSFNISIFRWQILSLNFRNYGRCSCQDLHAYINCITQFSAAMTAVIAWLNTHSSRAAHGSCSSCHAFRLTVSEISTEFKWKERSYSVRIMFPVKISGSLSIIQERYTLQFQYHHVTLPVCHLFLRVLSVGLLYYNKCVYLYTCMRLYIYIYICNIARVIL